MKLNLKNLNAGTFFAWEGELDGSKNGITVRELSSKELRRINKETLKKNKIIFDQKGVPIEVPVFDEDKQDELIYDYCIVDWSGLEDDDGKPIPCNAKNKVKLMQEEPVFMAFVTDCIKRVSVVANETEEAAEKN